MGVIDGLQAKPNNYRGMYAGAQKVLIKGATIFPRSCIARTAWYVLLVFRIEMPAQSHDRLKSAGAANGALKEINLRPRRSAQAGG